MALGSLWLDLAVYLKAVWVKGPQTWPKIFKEARGHHQSPIDIITKDAVFNKKLAENGLEVLYGTESCYQIKNTGHSFQVDGLPRNRSSK